jgi:hypothetical protein
MKHTVNTHTILEKSNILVYNYISLRAELS